MFLGLPLAFGSGRAISQLAVLLGPAFFFALLKKTGSGLRPLLSIPQPAGALRPVRRSLFSG
ncbi:hypothetical protein SGRA_3659 [Saprospira grandis str. Lewin]|uniref:Uncharacterized protein n=1 Tax=Saprospira grandis (strain Lewin) TaxID=984262 RepID=H6L6V0_SAPGL|nr:hypothetical protein SGRA_3659 [Saprospira grandis str. Lewin]